MHMGRENDIKCSFCRQKRDSINHIFSRCMHIKSFWEHFQTALHTGISKTMTVTLHENFILSGYYSYLKSDTALDWIIIFVSKVLYLSCKINKNIPQLHLLKGYLKNIFDVDEWNAILTMSYDKIDTEWLYYKKLIQI